MADAGQLDILIKLISDAAGAELTKDQIEQVKGKLLEMGESGKDAFDKIDNAEEALSFRTKQRISTYALEMAGIDGPVTTLLHHMEYIQAMAERTGLSLLGLFSQLGTGIAGVAAGSLVINKAIDLAKDADAAWEAAGLKVQGFWKNLQIGYGITDLPRISATIDFNSLGLDEIEQHILRIQREAEELTHRSTAAEDVNKEYAPQEAAIAARLAKLQPAQEQIGNIDQALSEAMPENLRPGQAPIEAAAAAARAAGVPVGPNSTYKGLIAEATAKLEELRKVNHETYQQIIRDQQTLRSNEDAALRERLYHAEDEKAYQEELRGNPEEAAKLRAGIAQMRDEKVFPGSERGDEIMAGLEGVQKQAKDDASAAKEHARQATKDANEVMAQNAKYDQERKEQAKKDRTDQEKGLKARAENRNLPEEERITAARQIESMEAQGVGPGARALLETALQNTIAEIQKQTASAAKLLDKQTESQAATGRVLDQLITGHEAHTRRMDGLSRRLDNSESRHSVERGTRGG